MSNLSHVSSPLSLPTEHDDVRLELPPPSRSPSPTPRNARSTSPSSEARLQPHPLSDVELPHVDSDRYDLNRLIAARRVSPPHHVAPPATVSTAPVASATVSPSHNVERHRALSAGATAETVAHTTLAFLEDETALATARLEALRASIRDAESKSGGIADSNARVAREVKLRQALDGEKQAAEARCAELRAAVAELESRVLASERSAGEAADVAHAWKERCEAFEVAYNRVNVEREEAAAGADRAREEIKLNRDVMHSVACELRSAAGEEGAESASPPDLQVALQRASSAVCARVSSLCSSVSHLTDSLRASESSVSDTRRLVREWEAYAEHWEVRGREAEALNGQWETAFDALTSSYSTLRGEYEALRSRSHGVTDAAALAPPHVERVSPVTPPTGRGTGTLRMSMPPTGRWSGSVGRAGAAALQVGGEQDDTGSAPSNGSGTSTAAAAGSSSVNLNAGGGSRRSVIMLSPSH